MHPLYRTVSHKQIHRRICRINFMVVIHDLVLIFYVALLLLYLYKFKDYMMTT
jgi:hypothetical protein